MKKTLCARWFVTVLLVGGLTACSPKEVQVGSWQVIPLPQEITAVKDAAPFVINSSTVICYPEGNEKLEKTAHFLSSYIREVTGTTVRVATKQAENSISLQVDPAVSSAKDGYELQVSSAGITVKGTTEAGVFYGIQTIYKALPITDGKALGAVPAGTVKDYPRFDYRGFMVDVGRHFFSVDYLKEIIDMLAMHHINYFHWHLTEDQGWRIEIKKYPKLRRLVRIGRKRSRLRVPINTTAFR